MAIKKQLQTMEKIRKREQSLSCSRSITTRTVYGSGLCLMAVLHAALLFAAVCQDLASMILHFKFFLATSLNLSLGRPWFRLPLQSCEYSSWRGR